MKTLYITDLDGTLLNKDQKVSPKSIEIINRLIDKGLLFTYATARSIVSASKVTEGLDITIPVVTGNGVSIVHPQSHKLISTLAFTKQEKNQLAESLKKRQIYPLVRAYVDGQDKCIWVKNKENPALCNYLNEPVRKIDPRLYPVSEFDDLWQGEVFYIICMGFEGELDSLYEDIRQQEKYRSLLTQQLYNTDFWLEIMPEQATKSNAILGLKKCSIVTVSYVLGMALMTLQCFRLQMNVMR